MSKNDKQRDDFKPCEIPSGHLKTKNNQMKSTYEMCVYSFDYANTGSERTLNLSGFDLITKKGLFKTVFFLKDTDTNQVIHSSTLYKFNLLSMQLFYFNYSVIGNCWTSEKYRGRGIYGKMVRYLVLNVVKRKAILFVEKKNLSSRKGLEKSGFKLIKTFFITRFFKVIALFRSI